MVLVEPFENGDTWSKVVAYAVSLPYAIAPLAYAGYQIHLGNQLDTFVMFMVVALTIVSAYKIWGKKNVKDALDEADEITPQGK